MDTTKLVAAFENELNLTEQGFIELASQKEGLVIDVKTEAGFKLARKERTEQNKILKNIDDLAISGKRSVDDARNTLKERVSNIYLPIVSAFEAEQEIRKEAARLKAEAEAERVNNIRAEIEGIRQFSMNLTGKDKDELQDIIEAVDMIDVSENFAELTQEAMQIKKETLSELNLALSAAIQAEKIEAEREQIRIEREEQQKQNAINELKAKAQDRLNTLIMIPSVFFGKSSFDINVKISSLENYEVKEEEFGELFHQANTAKAQVIQQLNAMHTQQLMVERSQAEQAAMEQQQAEEPVVEPTPQATYQPQSEESLTSVGMEAAPTQKAPIEQRLAERFSSAPVNNNKAPARNKAEMMRQLNFWKNEYGVRDTEFNDLLCIINQHAYCEEQNSNAA